MIFANNYLPLLPYEAPLPVDNGGSLEPNVIHAANESRFTESYFSEPLTSYAVGWRDPNNIEQTLEFFSPAIDTPRSVEFKKANNAEEFFSDVTDDIRATGADFKIVEFTGSTATVRTLNKGLTIVVDLDNVLAVGDWKNVYTGRLMRRLYRSELRRAVALLSAAATNTAKTWDTTAGKDPDNDVYQELIARTTVSGVRPNRVGYGDTAWSKRVTAHRAQDNAGGYTSAGLTPEGVRSFLQVDQVYVSKERYQSAAATKSQIVNNLVLMFYATSGMTVDDPSNIKRFVSPTLNGTRYRTYEQQLSAKRYAITVEHYSTTVVTSTLGIGQLTIS